MDPADPFFLKSADKLLFEKEERMSSYGSIRMQRKRRAAALTRRYRKRQRTMVVYKAPVAAARRARRNLRVGGFLGEQ